MFSKGKFLLSKILKNKKPLLILLVIFVSYSVLASGSPDKNKITTQKAKISSIQSEIISSGKVESHESSDLRFGVSGKVVSVLLKEGDRVSKGQVIAVLDQEKYLIALRSAEWIFQAEQAKFDKLYDELRGNTDETFDERIRRTAVDRDHNNAYESLLDARRNLRDTTLISPIDGVLTTLNIEVGDQILSTTDIGNVSDINSLVFRSEIDETDIRSLSEELRAMIILDSFPDEKIPSSIENIGLKSITTSTGATAYKVDYTLPENKNYRLGMNGEVTVVTKREENAIVVPIEALIDEEYIFVKEASLFKKKKVTVGILGDVNVQIEKGLSEGEEVVVGGFEEIEKKSILDKILNK